MWGCARITANCSSYEEAAGHYNSIKPVRGTDVRPIGCRRSRYAKLYIRKNGKCFEMVLWGTTVVTYRADGSVFLNHAGWRSVATAEAMSALSPFSAWCSKGELVVRNQDGLRFAVPGKGLEFRKDEAGQWQPVDPPVAVKHKTRVKREEAKKARAYYKQVPVFIKAFSAAFAGGTKPEGYPRISFHSADFATSLSEEDALNLAWRYVGEEYNYMTHKRVIVNESNTSIARFWREVYRSFSLVESYEVPLPYGEVE